MPEIFRLFGLRFFFYANDHLPVHVHVENADGEAKYNIQGEKVILMHSSGIKKNDLKLAKSLIEENKTLILNYWNQFFK